MSCSAELFLNASRLVFTKKSFVCVFIASEQFNSESGAKLENTFLISQIKTYVKKYLKFYADFFAYLNLCSNCVEIRYVE